MIYKYLRFSTSSQDERQQENTIDNYLSAKGLKADETITDAGISGGTNYKKRNLYELCKELQPNDVVIVSEVSRLTRSGIAELSEIIEQHFKPNKLHLIVCNVGLDIDCSDINPMIEMQLMMMATFAKIEKQLICDRTKSALAVRKKQLSEQGYFISKAGNKVTKLGGNGDTSAARAKSIESRHNAAKNNKSNKFLWNYMTTYQNKFGRITANTSKKVFQEIANELNKLGQTTARGLEYNPLRLRAAWDKVKNMYNN